MSLIGKQIGDFKVNAFHNGDITEVSKESTLGKWSLFFFYPADFTFVCPTELEDLANNYDKFQAAGADKGEVCWVEEEQAPLAQCGLLAYLSDVSYW